MAISDKSTQKALTSSPSTVRLLTPAKMVPSYTCGTSMLTILDGVMLFHVRVAECVKIHVPNNVIKNGNFIKWSQPSVSHRDLLFFRQARRLSTPDWDKDSKLLTTLLGEYATGLARFVAIGTFILMVGGVWTTFVTTDFTHYHTHKFSSDWYSCEVMTCERAGFDCAAFC